MQGVPSHDAPVYPIGTVERLTGLTARQIRYYETKGLVQPARTEGKQRLYSSAQVERLLRIKKLMAEGYSLKIAREILVEEESGEGTLEDPDLYPGRLGKESLSSLYPVSDHARLTSILDSRRREPPAKPR